jgi:surfactin synthase thioesterase subunit
LIIGSGSRPPSWRAEHRVVSKSDPSVTKCEPDLIHLLDDDAFIRHLAELGGTSAEVLANRELMEFCLPFLRADFELINTYQPSALTAADGVSPPLSSPLLVLGGRDDIGCPPQARQDWANITTSTTEVHVFDGGHFFIDQADTNGAMLQISGKLELLTKGAAQ